LEAKMKLIPFLRFGNGRGNEEESETVDSPLDELFEPPTDEETEQNEEDEKPEEEQSKEEDGDENKSMSSDDEMLKVFMTVDEEFVDNSGLASQMEDVPATELLQELRVLASAFGIRVEATQDEAV
jgi:hypothetical protein